MRSILVKLRSLFLPCGSKQETLFRTCYHLIMATKVAVQIQIWWTLYSFIRFQKIQIKKNPPQYQNCHNLCKVSFIMYVSEKNKLSHLIRTITSIQKLLLNNWEIIVLFTKASEMENLLLKNVNIGERVKFINYDQKVKNSWSRSIDGKFLLFCYPGDVFTNSILNYFYESLESFPIHDVFYYDCVYKLKGDRTLKPFFKPSVISPELSLSVNYLSRAFIRTSSALENFSSLGKSTCIYYQEQQLLLRLSENEVLCHHIPYVLLFQTQFSPQSDVSSENVITTYLTQKGLQGVKWQNGPNGRRVTWNMEFPSIAIIIPTKNNPKLIKNLLDSINKITDYQNYEIILVDNSSSDAVTLRYYESIKRINNIKIINYPRPFNYSEAINCGVKSSSSDLILLLNNDMQVIDPFWLKELAQWAMKDEIGVVGAKLIRENRSIQHAGVILGLSGFVGHLYLNAPEDFNGFIGSTNWYRNLCAVTGACQMARREVFDKVGGYDENYELVFGDIDFCLRVQDLGYRILYTPFARLFHYEGKTRGFNSPTSDILRAYNSFYNRIVCGDPYYSPNLTSSLIPACNTSLKFNQNELRKKTIDYRRQIVIENQNNCRS